MTSFKMNFLEFEREAVTSGVQSVSGVRQLFVLDIGWRVAQYHGSVEVRRQHC